MTKDTKDDSVHIYDQHAHKVTVARFQPPNSNSVASADIAGNIRHWSRNNINSLILEKKDLTDGVSDLCFTGDGTRILAVGTGKQQFGVAFMADIGSSVGNLTQHSRSAISVDSRPVRPFKAVSTGEDYQVSFYRGPPYTFVKAIEGHSKYVNCVRYSPDGEFFCTVGSDRLALIFEGKEGEFVGELDKENGHTGSIIACCWSPDSKKIITVGADKSAKLWDASSRKLEKSITFTGEKDILLGCGWLTQGPYVVGLNGDIHFLDLENFEKPKSTIHGHQIQPNGIVYDPSTNLVFTSAFDGVLVWEEGKGSKGRVTSQSISAMNIAGDKLVVVDQNKQVRFVPTSTLEYPSSEAFTLDSASSSISVCLQDPSLIVFKTNNGLTIAKDGSILDNFTFKFKVDSAAISPDGKLLAVGGKDNLIHFYKINGNSIEEIKTVDGHYGSVVALSFSNDGKFLASGDAKFEVRVTNVETFENAFNALTFHNSIITSVKFHPENPNLLVSGASDGEIILWKLNEKKRVQVRAHLGVVGLTWVKDGKELMSLGTDMCIKTYTLNE